MNASTATRVVAHPTKPGFWTILTGGRIYGEFVRRELAVAVMLTR